ncbi:energy transducer TonB [Luteimonas sp. MJ246]|uniref:energy transducer TonB n=1 Tax=Luteimonas sp. MJ174 TaxID=3129237 RepID=UPI0031BA6496
MVLQPEVRSPSSVPHARHAPPVANRPDPVRIAGVSGTLLLNGALLLLMLAPLSRPTPEPAGPRGLDTEWFEPRPVPPPPPPEIVPVERPVTPPAPTAPAQRVVEPRPVTVPPLVDGGSIPADPAPVVEQAAADIAPPATGPLTGMRLAYAQASAPPYPREALRAGLQGTVMLQVLVDIDGRPLRVQVHDGSGHRELDEAARRHVLRHWRFQPAMRDGRSVQAIGLVPIDFRLDRG